MGDLRPLVAAKHRNSEVIITRDCSIVACDAVYVWSYKTFAFTHADPDISKQLIS
jgi:hypothetical protein